MANCVELLSIENVPEYLKSNPYLTCGFRRCSTAKECVLSLRVWSISQWSAITSCVVFFYGLCLAGLSTTLPADSPAALRAVVLAMAVNAMLHSVPSAGYHIFGEAVGMGRAVFFFWQRLDFAMIHVSAIPLAYALCVGASHRRPHLWWLERVSCPLAAALSIAVIRAGPSIRTPSQRVLVISLLVLIYMLPVFSVWVYDPLSLQAVIGAVIAGALVYVMHFPECHSPNHWFGSHALMHVCLQIAFFAELAFAVLGVVS